MSIALAIATLGGLTACQDDNAAPPTVELEERSGPVGVHDLMEVCEGRVAMVDAPSYAGDAPHPVMAFSQGQGNADTSLLPRLDFSMWDDEGYPVNASLEETQLVACATRTAHAETDITCDFIADSDVPFFRAAYAVTVREVKTGTIVATIPVNPGAGGCPGSANVVLTNAQVFGSVTDPQLWEAVRAHVHWDGQGTPPGSPEQETAALTLSDPVVHGSVHLTAVAGIDPASPVIGDYLAFWAAYAAAEEASYPDPRDLRDVAEPTLIDTLDLLFYSRSDRGHTYAGPLYLTVTEVIDNGSTVFVDACQDSTERQILVHSTPDGAIGIQSRVRVGMVPSGDGYRAAEFLDAAPGPCPPAAAAVSAN